MVHYQSKKNIFKLKIIFCLKGITICSKCSLKSIKLFFKINSIIYYKKVTKL